MRARVSMLVVCLSSLLPVACEPVPEGEPDDGDADEAYEVPAQPLPLEGSPAAYGMLRVANELGFAELDDDVGLDRRAAVSIIVHRAGPDGDLDTVDDRYVEDLARLDALHWLGPETLWQIQRHALLEGFVPEALPDGCDPVLAEALGRCRSFMAGADGAATADASLGCVEGSGAEPTAAGYFASAGVPGYLDPALGYYALLCDQGDAPSCALGVAGLAEHALPECVAREG